jgi:hypothetical protein
MPLKRGRTPQRLRKPTARQIEVARLAREHNGNLNAVAKILGITRANAEAHLLAFESKGGRLDAISDPQPQQSNKSAAKTSCEP